jgi:hypothetical protein
LDDQTLTLTETGPDTGIFRNSTGLQTQISDGTITAEDNLWEDTDQGEVTATFTYGGTPYETTASLFYADDAGRVYFMNGAGTVDIEQYAADEPVFIKVEDESYTCGGTMSVTITTDAGDSESIDLYETFSGSNVYMNRTNDLVTTASSAVVTSASSTFVTDGIQMGDLFVIATGPDAGTYTVASDPTIETQITLTETLTETRTDIGFNAQPLMTSTYDGGVTSDDGILEAADSDTLTVTYTDCTDGDTDSSNDDKTDTVTYNAPPIVINEVLFYPDEEYEYIQLYNASSGSVNVTGYTITDEDSGFSYDIPQCDGSDIVLIADQELYVVLVPNTPVESDCPTVEGDPYYVYVQVSSFDELGDPKYPLTTDTADQISLYNGLGTIVDYVGWSTTSTNTIDFKSDDEYAVTADIWQDNDYRDVGVADPITQGYAIYRCSEGVDSDDPSDWCYKESTLYEDYIITLAVISSFDVYEDEGDVVVEWETASEIGTVGFYLYRKDKATREYVQLNDDLLPAVLHAQQGGTYRYVDETAFSGETYKYKIVEVEASGKRRKYGPFVVTVGREEAGLSWTWPIAGPSKKLRTARAARKASQGLKVAGFAGNSGRPARALDTSEVSDLFSFKAHEMSARGKARRETRRLVSERAGTMETSSAGERIKIPVSQDGLYYLDASEISRFLGLRLRNVKRMIKRKGLSLSNQGEEAAYLPAGGNIGIYFYGEGIDSIYTNENIYWLTQGSGLKMKTVEGAGPGSVWGDETFARTVHEEEDQDALPNLFSEPDEDYWFWDFVIAGGDQKSFSIPSHGAANDSMSATLTVNLKGATDDPGTDPDHHVVVSMNGEVIGEGYWDGTASPEPELVLTFDQRLLNNGENVVDIAGILDTGAPYSIFYVDSFDLVYQSLYQAHENKLSFGGDQNPVVTVSGFAGPDIFVIEVTDPKNPKLIESKTVEWTAAGWSVSIEPASPGALYCAVGLDAVMSELDARADASSTLATSDNSVDYLLIAPEELRSGAERLADYRRSRGLSAMVVNLADIMDEFNHGIYSPEVIRDFLSYAYNYWNASPAYVVLVGDGTIDYKDNLGYGDNLVPPIMVGTPDGLFASDNRFVDAEGDDGIPEMAIGRLPVLTDEELQGIINKIIAYETAADDWTQRVLMVADDPDGDGDFPSDSDDLALRILPEYAVEKIYLSQLTLDDARQRLIDGVNLGAGILNYIGHAGVARLAQEGVLLKDDMALLTNGDRPVVVNAFTCVVGQFSIPGYDTLSEALILQDDGGAVAVWSPTGMSINAQAKVLGEEFFDQAMAGGAVTLGQAVLRALEVYGERGNDMYMLDIYNILGDPALELR